MSENKTERLRGAVPPATPPTDDLKLLCDHSAALEIVRELAALHPLADRRPLIQRAQTWLHSPGSAVPVPQEPTDKENTMDDLDYLDIVKNPPVGGIFHWRDGWYFQRTQLGAVLVTLPNKSQKVIPPNEWASIVAHVSCVGETAHTYAAALALHGER